MEMTLTMSGKEVLRAGLVKAALAGRITNQQGATALGLTLRQFQRLKVRFVAEGAAGLVHRSRGRPSPRRVPAAIRVRVGALRETTYADFNDCHFADVLAGSDDPELRLSRSTVRRLRRALGLPAKHRRRRTVARHRRAPEAAMGAMIQVDASPFAWFEARGPMLALVGAIDDATGAIVGLTFRPTEDLHGYAEVFRQVFTQYGLPVSIYGDRINILVRNDAHWTLEEELQGAQEPTHLGRMLQDLAIGYIAAHSPQAKGRIERLWQTLQDRLVSELRVRGIATIDAANAFLPEFIAGFNRRFARTPETSTAVWRRPPPDLDLVLSCRYTRTVANDHTVRIGSRRINLPAPSRGRSWAGCRVDVRELLSGELVVLYHDVPLATQPWHGPFALIPRSAPSNDRRRQRAIPRQTSAGASPARASASELRPSLTINNDRDLRTPTRRRPAPDHPWRTSHTGFASPRRRARVAATSGG
jgi:winged helix-turn helix protein